MPREVGNKSMTWTIQRPKCDGWYWVRNAATEGWEGDPEPHVVRIYGFTDGQPTVTFPSEEDCSDLAAVDAEWCGPLEVPQ
jgi:hypothetical protein